MGKGKISKNIKTILVEIESVLNSTNQKEIDSLIEEILKAKNIILLGAGRMGLVCKAFSIRLSHLGLNSYFLGDSNTPSVGKKDLVIVASGSGETQTIYDLAKMAKDNKAKVFLITANLTSRIGKLSNGFVIINAPTKFKRKPKSIQPMTTLNEQCLLVFFDAVILILMQQTKETHDSMGKRHSNLE